MMQRAGGIEKTGAPGETLPPVGAMIRGLCGLTAPDLASHDCTQQGHRRCPARASDLAGFSIHDGGNNL